MWRRRNSPEGAGPVRDNLIVRNMTEADLALALEWAAAEGWNPGLHDAHCFYAADPQGFFVGERDGLPIGCVSAVRYGSGFGFLGLYIVKAEHRGQGFGLELWRAALDHLGDRVIGLDGVVAQQENYRKSGFRLAFRNIRQQGRAEARRPRVLPTLRRSRSRRSCATTRRLSPRRARNSSSRGLVSRKRSGLASSMGEGSRATGFLGLATKGSRSDRYSPRMRKPPSVSFQACWLARLARPYSLTRPKPIPPLLRSRRVTGWRPSSRRRACTRTGAPKCGSSAASGSRLSNSAKTHSPAPAPT
jgi:GNAT superfamily N-acetyltransferase